MTRRVILILVALLGAVVLPARAQSQGAMEYRLKAALINHFIQNVEWPKGAGMKDSSKPFVIGVIGKNPFGKILDTTFNKRKMKGKYVKILYFSELDKIPGCHLLFVPASKKSDLNEILAATRGKPVLTVSDSRGFGEAGIHFNFFLEKKRVRFEINLQVARESGFVVAEELLAMSLIIHPMKEVAEGLGKFADYVRWPIKSEVYNTSVPFVIGVIGGKPFGGMLERTYKEGKIKEKKVEIDYLQGSDKIQGCNMLFITEMSDYELVKILEKTRERPILTVANTAGYAEKGVHINIYFDDKGILRYEVNREIIEKAGLRPHASFLKYARIVAPKK